MLDLGGEKNPWKDRALIQLATAGRRHGLVSGAKPWRRLLSWRGVERVSWQRERSEARDLRDALPGRRRATQVARSRWCGFPLHHRYWGSTTGASPCRLRRAGVTGSEPRSSLRGNGRDVRRHRSSGRLQVRRTVPERERRDVGRLRPSGRPVGRARCGKRDAPAERRTQNRWMGRVLRCTANQRRRDPAERCSSSTEPGETSLGRWSRWLQRKADSFGRRSTAVSGRTFPIGKCPGPGGTRISG